MKDIAALCLYLVSAVLVTTVDCLWAKWLHAGQPNEHARILFTVVLTGPVVVTAATFGIAWILRLLGYGR